MTKPIRYSSHLTFRLKRRDIPQKLPTEVFEKAKEYFYDIKTNHYIAVTKIVSKGKEREMMVVFDVDEIIELITIHPLKRGQKESRVKFGRWIGVREKEW
ncbi:MAG: hypothetical protein QMC77_03775 [Methanocellales archaeon]|nr:hypothetical protein [Methanocellales archaeon]